MNIPEDAAKEREERIQAIIQWLRAHVGVPNRNERLGLADMGSWVSIMTVAFFISEYFISIYSEAVVSPYLVDIHSSTLIQDFVRDELGVDQTRALLAGMVLYFVIKELATYINRLIKIVLDYAEDNFYKAVKIFCCTVGGLVVLAVLAISEITSSGLLLFCLFLFFLLVTFAKKVSIKVRFALYPIIVLFIFPIMIVPGVQGARAQLSGYPVYMYTSAPGGEKIAACKITRLGEVLKVNSVDQELLLSAGSFLKFEVMPPELFLQEKKRCDELFAKTNAKAASGSRLRKIGGPL